MHNFQSTHKYINPEPSKVECWYYHCEKKIIKFVEKNDIKTAINIAYEWIEYLCERLNIKNERNWKLFKKALVRKYFGNYVSERFYSGWDYKDILRFINNYNNVNFRISIFPNNIACRSTSIPLLYESKNQWESILSHIDNSKDVEIFEQASSDNTICFRRYSTQFGEELLYEIGFGQAMNVFENEQGFHEIVSASKIGNHFKILTSSNNSRTYISKFENLIFSMDYFLHSICKIICSDIGIEWTSIEGYFNDISSTILVVDIDLPFDYLFMLKTENI